MKSIIKNLLVVALFIGAFNSGFSQDKEVYITATTAHWNWDNDGSNERWLELEKAWHDNVVVKNEHILSSGVYHHMYTEDNSEVVFITVYPTWNDIELAGKRASELAKEAWPDDEERSKTGQERNAYYSTYHSDEIWVSLPNTKFIGEVVDGPYVILVVTKHLAFPDDADSEEFAALDKEFHGNVTHKNPHLLGFYPTKHIWGSDGREVTHVYAVKDMAALTAMQDAIGELVEAHWPDEEARKEFFKKYNRYYTPFHSDKIFQSEPELLKAPIAPPKDADAEE